MLGGTTGLRPAVGKQQAQRLPKHLRKKYLMRLRWYRRDRLRGMARQARRLTTLVNARKGTVIAVVGAALVALVALGGTLGAFAAHHWWIR